MGSDVLDKYTFYKEDDISDYPNIERMVGYGSERNADSSWLTYYQGIMPEGYSLYDKGTCIVEHQTTHRTIQFDSDMDKMSGTWIIRKGEDNNVLLWKPLSMNEKYACPCSIESGGGEIQENREKYSWEATSDTRRFKGTMVAAGVYSGMLLGPNGISFVFPNSMIRKVYEKYKANPEQISVDWNHDEQGIGKITSLELKEEPLTRIVATGITNKPVPRASALSIDAKQSYTWDSTLSARVISDLDLKRVSLLNGAPGCKICYLE